MEEEYDRKRRIRSTNYTLHEKEVLLTIVNKYKGVIENKKTDGVSVEQKNNIWVQIAKEFNATAPNLCYRAVDSLRKYYENQKKNVRKKVGDEKKAMYLTGGGSISKIPTDPTDELLLSIVNEKTVFGLENPCDSDKLIENKTSSSNVLVEEISHKEEEINRSTLGEQNIEFAYDTHTDKENHTPQPTGRVRNDYKHHNDSLQENNNTDVHLVQLQDNTTSNLTTPNAKRSTEAKEIHAKRARVDLSRRRPVTTIRTLTSSTLAEKYEILIDKKLDLVECQKKEHELRMEILRLDIEIRKKELNKL